jgi:hypothetical protein
MDENGFFAVEDGTKAVAFSLASDRQSVESLIAAANRAESERWIPVSERLPENANDVLVLVDRGHYSIASLVNGEDGRPAWDSGNWHRAIPAAHGSVTHWRPLPAAPKEVQT